MRKLNDLYDAISHVTLNSFVRFFLQELNMNRPNDRIRLIEMLEVILIRGQNASNDRISRF